jgi:hypothetical protein
MSDDVSEEALPDARMMISVSTEGTHDLEKGIQELNPILQEILQARLSPPDTGRAMRQTRFGRLRFSQHVS